MAERDTITQLIDILETRKDYKLEAAATLGPDEITRPVEYRFEVYAFNVDDEEKTITLFLVE